jgi:glutathione S-transferase
MLEIHPLGAGRKEARTMDRPETPTNTINLKRRIGAKRARVYKALTAPDIAKNWWGGGGGPWEITGLTLDAKPGGKFEFNMKNADDGQEYHTHGEYQDVVENERLVWTNAEGGGTIVEVNLYDVEDAGTELHVSQGSFPDEDTRDQHEAGWNAALDQMDALLRG